MSYSKTTWSEHGHTTTQKLSCLDNLEGMYTQAVSYIDAITHSERYYDEATCSSKYFTSVTDGSGSGLIAATLDGLTAAEIIAAGTPSGNIAMWSGSEASIPSGWVLCNGLNGAPDMRDRFVPGAGSHYANGDTGGADTVTTAGTVTIAGHTLTTSEIPKHTHGSITDYYPATVLTNYRSASGSGTLSDITGTTTQSAYTGYAGGGGSHTHAASFSGTSAQDKRPPFYALCFIMVAI